MAKRFVVGIGEILWDVSAEGRTPGGAPANFALHANQLGADARVISRVGKDEDGQGLLAWMKGLDLPDDTVETDDSRPTGVVTVTKAAGEPSYVIHANAAWDHITGRPYGFDAAATADAVCFGTLAQRCEESRRAIQALVRATRAGCLRVLDVNLRQEYYSREVIAESLEAANVLKVNEKELPVLSRLFDLRGDERGRIAELARRYSLLTVAYTRGEHGSILFSGGEWSELPAAPTTVVDAVGAGDSFTAAVTTGLLAGWPLDILHRRAAEVAAFVCSREGGTPGLPDELREPFASASHQAQG